MGPGFSRRLPRSIRLLWYAVVVVTAVELALVIATLVFFPSWSWLTLQLFSLSLWPVGGALAVVLVVGSFTNRGAQPATTPARPAEPKRERTEGYEVAAARGAAQVLAGAARTPQGKAAVRRAARLARAVRAAATPSQAPEQDHRPSPPATPAEPGRGGEERQ